MVGPQRLKRCPLLAVGVDVLAVILADRAVFGHCVGGRVLRATGGADEVGHGKSPGREAVSKRKDSTQRREGVRQDAKGCDDGTIVAEILRRFTVRRDRPGRSSEQVGIVSDLSQRIKNLKYL